MNKAEKSWFAFLHDYGCIPCRRRGFGYVSPQIHHLLRGGRRIDHMHTIPLCPTCHGAGIKTAEFVSRHPWRKEFEKRYGAEKDMLKEVQTAYRRRYEPRRRSS